MSYAALVAVVLVVSAPLCAALAPEQRPLVLRLAAALLLGVALVDAVRLLHERLDGQPPSRLDGTIPPAEAPSDVDRHLRNLRDELRAAAASERYFDRVLWPRLTSLAQSLPAPPALVVPPRSFARRLFRRGPAPTALRDLVARLEGRR
jgi:hypothetical protein